MNRLTATLIEILGRSAIVRVQSPVQLDEHTEPLPDIAVLTARDDYYMAGHPKPEDTLLVIEAADSSIVYDLQEKAPLYARSMVPEVWVVDLVAEVVRVFAQPGPSGYAEERVAARGETILSASVEELRIKVDEIFGPIA